MKVLWLLVPLFFFSRRSLVRSFGSGIAQLVDREAMKQDVDKRLVRAIIKVESDWNPQAFNPEGTGSFGLMQIQCSTAEFMGFSGNCRALFDPRVNLIYGVKYVRWQLDRYGDMPKAIAAYNAGTAFSNPDGTFRNQRYVDKVLAAL